MSDKKTLRERAPNFSSEEVHKLVEIVENHQEVIECKKTDGKTWREKDAEWNKVASEFNATSTVVRSQASLRLKYDLLKKTARKRRSLDRQEQLKTGGGPYIPPKPDAALDKIEKLIPLSIYGLVSTVDSDHIHNVDLGECALSADEDTIMIEMDADENCMPDWSHGEDSSYVLQLDESMCGDYDATEANPSLETASNAAPASSTSACTVVHPVASTSKCDPVNVWDKYTPAMLRQPKHPALTRKITHSSSNKANKENWMSRRRPILSEKQVVANSVSTNNFSSMASSKKELADLKKKILFDEQQGKKELHAMELKLRESQLKIFDLDIKIRQAQLKSLELDIKFKEDKLM